MSDPRNKAWMGFREQFNRVLHGSASTDEVAFRARLAAVESFLMDWLRPQPLQDLPLLEKILREGPPGA